MELLSLLLLIGLLVGVYAVMLRPPTPGAKARRRSLGISGNHRDRDPIGTSVLVAVAVADLATTAGGIGLNSAVVTGVLLAAVLAVAATRPLVYTAVGAIALLTAVRDVAVDAACGGSLSAGQAAAVYLTTALFLVLVGVVRVLVAPLRATGAEARGALLAVYGVLQGTVYSLELTSRGGLDGWPLGGYAGLAACLAVLAAGTAVQPVFATATLGVGLALLALASDVAAQCVDQQATIGVLLGFFGPALILGAVRGRRRKVRR